MGGDTGRPHPSSGWGGQGVGGQTNIHQKTCLDSSACGDWPAGVMRTPWDEQQLLLTGINRPESFRMILRYHLVFNTMDEKSRHKATCSNLKWRVFGPDILWRRRGRGICCEGLQSLEKFETRDCPNNRKTNCKKLCREKIRPTGQGTLRLKAVDWNSLRIKVVSCWKQQEI